ncbi:telomerase Cajal body protein 1 [Ciona intestinalis]
MDTTVSDEANHSKDSIIIETMEKSTQPQPEHIGMEETPLQLPSDDGKCNSDVTMQSYNEITIIPSLTIQNVPLVEDPALHPELNLTCNTEISLDNLNTQINKSNGPVDNQHVPCQIKGENLTCRMLAKSVDSPNGNYLKGCKWSPDGLCFLVNSNDCCVKLFNTPSSCMKQEKLNDEDNLQPCLKAVEPEIVYDFCWWPQMNSGDPATCCFATAAKDQPVHLWDAFTGELRASYIALNSVVEIQAVHSLAFCPDGQQLLCGCKRELVLFYTDRPGSDFEKWSTCKKNSSKKQNNIISSVEFGPDGRVFACGCYDGTVGLYSPMNGNLLEQFQAHKHGVTKIRFATDGIKLYSGARNEDLLKCWDIRYLTQPVFEVTRTISTNQRVYFDLVQQQGHSEELLVSGGTDGVVRFWDVTESPPKPCHTFTAHNDCANGCSVHPYLPLLLTSSGQRKYPEPLESDDESEELLSMQGIAEENNVKIWLLSNDPAL